MQKWMQRPFLALFLGLVTCSFAVGDEHHGRIAHRSKEVAQAAQSLVVHIERHPGYRHLADRVRHLERLSWELHHAAVSGEGHHHLRSRFEKIHLHMMELSSDFRLAHETHRHRDIHAAWQRLEIEYHQLKALFPGF